jgi:anthranilate synthase component 2
MKKILLIDNYDSFTYNIFHSLSELGSKVEVYRNDKISLEQISKKKFDKIVISPGPGHPNSSGICINVVKKFYKKIPILGICLGHQIIGAAFGGVIKRAKI